jgi:hypothetical protein
MALPGPSHPTLPAARSVGCASGAPTRALIGAAAACGCKAPFGRGADSCRCSYPGSACNAELLRQAPAADLASHRACIPFCCRRFRERATGWLVETGSRQ